MVRSAAVRPGSAVAGRESHISAWPAVIAGCPPGPTASSAPACVVRSRSPLPSSPNRSRRSSGFSAACRFFTTSTWLKPSTVDLSTRSTPGSTSV